MLFGRFFMVIPVLAIAGSLVRKKHVPESSGTFPVTTPLFTGLLISVILIVGALTFFPALAASSGRDARWVRHALEHGFVIGSRLALVAEREVRQCPCQIRLRAGRMGRRPGARLGAGPGWLSDDQRPHHVVLFVFQNMAVPHVLVAAGPRA